MTWLHAPDCPAGRRGICNCRPTDGDEHQGDANTTSGWSAECIDCPYTIEPMYGARCYPRTESGDRGDVVEWVRRHVERFPGHGPVIASFTRWTVHISQVNPTVFETLFGQLPDDDRDHVAELRDTVQRVKNIVWQNFGIEPSVSPYRALPAGMGAAPFRCPECGFDYWVHRRWSNMTNPDDEDKRHPAWRAFVFGMADFPAMPYAYEPRASSCGYPGCCVHH